LLCRAFSAILIMTDYIPWERRYEGHDIKKGIQNI